VGSRGLSEGSSNRDLKNDTKVRQKPDNIT
jgi:hypothetical protein